MWAVYVGERILSSVQIVYFKHLRMNDAYLNEALDRRINRFYCVTG